ncbi:FMN-binding protein [Streptomyces sp. NPDC055681]
MPPLSKKFTTALVALAATTVIAGCSATDTNGASSPSASTASPSPSRSSANRGPYKDGEYSVNGEYGTRGSSIGVSLTLQNGEISAADITPHATDETSLGLQRRFAEAVPALVVGKDIDDVDLDRVAGNSHTSDGFNDALEKIKAEATERVTRS